MPFRIKLDREKIDKELKNWIERGNELFDMISSTFNEFYMFIDEFSECIKNMIRKKEEEEAIKLLQWLRSIRQTYNNIKFIVGGSTSFHRVISNLNVSQTINDLKPISVNAFSKEAAKKYIKEFFKKEKIKYDEKTINKMLELMGPPIPYFLSIFLDAIKNYKEEKIKKLDNKRIEKIYYYVVLDKYGKWYFDYYRQRIKVNYEEPFATAVKEILRMACNNDIDKDSAYTIFVKVTGIDDEEKFIDLLYEMENDFYIKLRNNKITFYSKMLRDWWIRYA